VEKVPSTQISTAALDHPAENGILTLRHAHFIDTETCGFVKEINE
jgi:hypothetical protein